MIVGSSPPAYAPRPSATGKERINALDGLRAVALLIIMGYHFGVGWLQGGFFSLDIFYVLSGYLITGLLVSEYRKRSAIKLSAFWLRRARRLLPALLIVLVAVTLLVRFVSAPGLYLDFRMSAPVRVVLLLQLVADRRQQQLLRRHRGGVPAHPHLVVGRRGAVLPGLAPGGAGRDDSQSNLRAGDPGPVGRCRWLGAVALGPRDGLALPPDGQHHPALLRDRHPRPVHPGRLGPGLRHDHGPDATRQGGDGTDGAARRSARSSWSPSGLAGFAGTLILTYTLVGTSAIDYRGGFMLSALSAAAIIVGGGVRAHRGDRPGPVAPPPGVVGHHLLWGLPLALPGLRLPRHRPDRPAVASGSWPSASPAPSRWPRPATTWWSARSCTGRSGVRSRPSPRPSP